MLNVQPSIGSRIEDIITPALLIDLDALERNFRVIAETYSGEACKMRQHAKNIKSPIVLQRQIDIGGTLGGVCAAKVAEAEVMIHAGIKDVLITSQIVGKDKLERLAGLAKIADVKVCVDQVDNLRELSKVATSIGSKVGVLIEVDTSMGRAGVRSEEEGVILAKECESLPSVEFLGVMSHQTVEGWPNKETRFTEGRRYIEKCLAVKSAVEASGIDVKMVSSGETFSYDVAPQIEGVTEVEGGTYALMSAPTGYMTQFEIAGKVLTSVIGTRGNIVHIDAGFRCLGGPMGVTPVVESDIDIQFMRMEDTTSVLKSDISNRYEIGEQLYLQSSQQDILVNRWDQFIAVRNGLVEGVWDITARGCHH